MADVLPLPTEIAGVKIPQISLDDLADMGRLRRKAAQIGANVALKAAGLDQVPDQAKEVNDVLIRGVSLVKDSCQVLSASADAVSSIQEQVEPVMPLLCVMEDPLSAFQSLSKENLQVCMQVIKHVLGLSDTLQIISKVLQEVRAAFAELAKASQPIIDKVMETLGDVAKEFETVLHLEDALTGVEGFFTQLSSMVSELGAIKDEVGPILEAWEKEDYSTAAQFGAVNWQQVVDALKRFMPAWVGCQELYNKSRGYCASSLEQTNSVCKSFTSLVQALSKEIAMDVPDWLIVDPLAGVVAPRQVDTQEKPVTKPASLPFTMDEEHRSRLANCCKFFMRAVGKGSRARANEQTPLQDGAQ